MIEMKKQFTIPNKIQLYYKEVCIDSATKHKGDYCEVTITNEKLYEFSGVLTFFLHVKAKENTGMLFLCDKTWFVKIGRRGGVRSTKMHDKKGIERINRYCIFIA